VRSPSVLDIQEVNPLDHAAAIKGLFVEHGLPLFPTFFDRIYPEAVDHGARSWVAFAEDGRLAMHIVRFRSEFAWKGRKAVGGVTANLLVAKEHRSLGPALNLLRRAIADSRGAGYDFLFTNPNAASRPVLQLAAFREIGRLARHVLPVAESSPFLDLPIRLRHQWYRWRVGTIPGDWQPLPAMDADVPLPLSSGDSSGLTPLRTRHVYNRRIKGYPGPEHVWYLAADSPATADAPTVLLRRLDGDRGEILALNPPAVAAIDRLALTLAPTWRAAGLNRVELIAVAESDLARRAVRGGFIPRPDDSPLTAIGLTDLGREVTEGALHWNVCSVDLDGPAE